ncbi:hypothetical protein [Anaerorhabdus sp.]|uniref:hypothetical protein n=1 Tax=Anaerorhabdus sp. TaxID=1872524 RepID=UPI002FC5AEF5
MEVTQVLNITEKHDEKINRFKREIGVLKKELAALKEKNERDPGKKFIWTTLEIITWIIVGGAWFITLQGENAKVDDILVLIIVTIPILLAGFAFNKFKNMYKVEEDRFVAIESKIKKLNILLEKAIEEKINIINIASTVAGHSVNNSQIPESDEKECPMCAEKIKYKAKICRFCRYEF